MTWKIIAAVAFGVLFGRFFLDTEPVFLSTLLDVGLCLLLFFVGIDVGKNKDVVKQIKEIGIKAVTTPLTVAVGTIVGSIVFGSIFGYSPKDASLLGAGFGWYTLSPIIIAPYSAQLSALAFLANVTREVLAIISIPMVAKYIGYTEAIAPAGATAMDTTLPIVSRSTDAQTTIVSFVTGLVLSLSVPILLPFILAL